MRLKAVVVLEGHTSPAHPLAHLMVQIGSARYAGQRDLGVRLAGAEAPEARDLADERRQVVAQVAQQRLQARQPLRRQLALAAERRQRDVQLVRRHRALTRQRQRCGLRFGGVERDHHRVRPIRQRRRFTGGRWRRVRLAGGLRILRAALRFAWRILRTISRYRSRVLRVRRHEHAAIPRAARGRRRGAAAIDLQHVARRAGVAACAHVRQGRIRGAERRHLPRPGVRGCLGVVVQVLQVGQSRGALISERRAAIDAQRLAVAADED